MFVGFRMKYSEYILIANGEATTVRTIRRRPVSERWANPEEIINVPVCPWDRPEHRQEAGVRPMGARRERNHELDEAPFPKPPAGAGPSERVYLKQSDFDARGLTQGCPGCRAIREGMRAQGHSAVCRARMEELLQATAKGQQRLQEAERRARETAGERASQTNQAPVCRQTSRSREPHQCKSQRRHCRGRCCKCEQLSVQGVSLKMLATRSQVVSLKMQLQTPRCQEGPELYERRNLSL